MNKGKDWDAENKLEFPTALTPNPASDNTLTSRVGTYEDLAIDLQFLQKAYVTALASREAARLEADRAQRYLAAFVKPATPQRSTYPKRLSEHFDFCEFRGDALGHWRHDRIRN